MNTTLTVAGEEYRVRYMEDVSGVEAELDGRFPFLTYDTESTGLHLKADRPFLAAVCYDHDVYVFPATAQNVQQLAKWSRKVKRVYAHNTTFDMHMTANVTDDMFPVREIKNWGDSQCLARLTFEAISVREGGDSLALKRIGKKYIDPNADQWERQVKEWLEVKRRADKKVLTAFLKPLKWSASRLEKALKNDEDIPEEVLNLYAQWQELYPKPTYQDVPMEIMLPYVATDVILTKILILKALPVIVHRNQQEVMDREFRVLPVVYKMERRGIRVDREYLMECRDRLVAYIDLLYDKLYAITGIKFTVGQQKVIKQMYADMLGTEPESTDKKFLKKMEAKGDEAAPLITRIRRFEKWLATYIERILKVSEYDGRFYTSMNQFNPVSGRFSGDAQQFPKDPIYTEEGYQFEKDHPNQSVPDEYVLYHPRRAFLGRIYYLDYSQVELRVQAHYTLYFGGDVNMCRAYMPYKCVHYKTGEEYDHTTPDGRKHWGDLRDDAPTGFHWEDALEQGWSAWVNPDTGKPWIPTDVHMATTLKALVAMGFDPDQMDKDLIKWWRKKGKTFNFMRNYGGGDKKAAETLDITLEQAKALNRGYTDAFPKVITYQNAVISKVRRLGYGMNLYGRRYYLSKWYYAYKVANYLIQGSCADMLKEKMTIIDQFLVENGLEDKLGMILCVHDELQFEKYTDENLDWAVAEIKRIMENTPDILVPIVAEVEYTETDWSAKKKIALEVAA